MAVRKRKNEKSEKSKSESKNNDDKSENNEEIKKSSSKLSIICLGKLIKLSGATSGKNKSQLCAEKGTGK